MFIVVYTVFFFRGEGRVLFGNGFYPNPSNITADDDKSPLYMDFSV